MNKMTLLKSILYDLNICMCIIQVLYVFVKSTSIFKYIWQKYVIQLYNLKIHMHVYNMSIIHKIANYNPHIIICILASPMHRNEIVSVQKIIDISILIHI